MDYMISHKCVKLILNLIKFIIHKICMSLNIEEDWSPWIKSPGSHSYFINDDFSISVLVLYVKGFDGGGNICIMIQSDDMPPPLIKQPKSITQCSPNFYLLGSVRSIQSFSFYTSQRIIHGVFNSVGTTSYSPNTSMLNSCQD